MGDRTKKSSALYFNIVIIYMCAAIQNQCTALRSRISYSHFPADLQPHTRSGTKSMQRRRQPRRERLFAPKY